MHRCISWHRVKRHCHVAQRTSIASVDSDSPVGQPRGILLHVFDDATSAGVLGQGAAQAAMFRTSAVVVRTSNVGGTKKVIRGEQFHCKRLHGDRLRRRLWLGVLVIAFHHTLRVLFYSSSAVALSPFYFTNFMIRTCMFKRRDNFLNFMRQQQSRDRYNCCSSFYEQIASAKFRDRKWVSKQQS